MDRITLMIGILLVATPALAQQAPLSGPPKLDGYGPGVHMDATGRPFTYQGQDGFGPAHGSVKPNAYGPGIGMDATGRPVEARPYLPGGSIPAYSGRNARASGSRAHALRQLPNDEDGDDLDVNDTHDRLLQNDNDAADDAE